MDVEHGNFNIVYFHVPFVDVGEPQWNGSDLDTKFWFCL